LLWSKQGQELLSLMLSPALLPAHQFQFWVNFTGPVGFQLQPYPLREFELSAQPRIEPFGENEYFYKNVMKGFGRQFLDGSHAALLAEKTIADVSVERARDVAASLIDVATRTAARVPAPSGIGGGVDCALVGRETTMILER
jgi:hypothetical protein